MNVDAFKLPILGTMEATKITELAATLPNFVVSYSYNSFSFLVENPRAGFVCYASHKHKASNGF